MPRDTQPFAPAPDRPARGAAPVGHLDDLDPVEATAVLCLRLWCEGPEAQAQVWADFATTLGPSAGRAALADFEELCGLCLRHARRPLMRHGLGCRCLGADEACFAAFIGYAAEGRTEDAFLMAAAMVRPDLAHALTGLAQSVGLAFRRMALRAGAQASVSGPAPAPAPARLH